MRTAFDFDQIVLTLEKLTKQSVEPMTQQIVFLYGKDPYLILISCLLSLQNRDVVSLAVSRKLFAIARTPHEMAKLPLPQLEQIIKSVNFYKTKAKRIHAINTILIEKYGGQVPATREELLAFKGVGLKTTNLVLAEAFDIPAICVDTHVHRLSNHWGIVHTKTPDQTEAALRQILPRKHWIVWNYVLVKYGQSICKTKRCGAATCQLITNMVQ